MTQAPQIYFEFPQVTPTRIKATVMTGSNTGVSVVGNVATGRVDEFSAFVYDNNSGLYLARIEFMNGGGFTGSYTWNTPLYKEGEAGVRGRATVTFHPSGSAGFRVQFDARF